MTGNGPMMGATDATGALDAASAGSTAERGGPSPDVTVLVPEGLLTSHSIDVASAKPRTNATIGEMTRGDSASTRVLR